MVAVILPTLTAVLSRLGSEFHNKSVYYIEKTRLCKPLDSSPREHSENKDHPINFFQNFQIISHCNGNLDLRIHS